MPLKQFWNFIIDLCVYMCCVLSHDWLFATPWTVGRQAPLSLGIQSNVEICNTICKTDSQWEFAVWLSELKQGLCDRLKCGMGREMGGRSRREGTWVHLCLTLVDVWQKTTTFCKATILQLTFFLKIKNKKYWSGDLPNPGIKPRSPALQGDFQGNFYHLSHQGSPWVLEWVASPLSRGTSQPRNRTRVSCIAGGFFTSCATREAPLTSSHR